MIFIINSLHIKFVISIAQIGNLSIRNVKNWTTNYVEHKKLKHELGTP
jgi:hypothetical protein